ncbi:hypothetical protein ZWY2020_023389 [Hordeum vulgare]|nr:hypothetical protein ZWY2020_023389 [Hordeum vulgare]
MSSDEEHRFELRLASKTFTQQARTTRKRGYIVVENRPCRVVDVSTSGSGGYASCHFVAIDIFTGEKFEYSVSSSRNCDVPYVIITECHLVDIPDDGGFVTLLTDTGSTKDDIKLPTDDSLRDQLKDGFNEGKDLTVSVMSAMGEEQICGYKDIAPR